LNSIIKYSLGWALLLTSVAVLFKKTINYIAKHAGDKFHSESKTRNVLTIGIVLLSNRNPTSIGAGALGTVTLFFLYPATPRLVGTEIAHAVPLTLVAGLDMRPWEI
jgi:multisubunit Na+/H+ antiporter MnhB subunit